MELTKRIITKEEQLPNNTELLKLTIPGRPTTKKTHQQIVRTNNGRLVLLPSDTYQQYEKLCAPFCKKAWKKNPMDFGVSIHMKIFLDDWRFGDHVGYMQALGDIIEKHGIISNDKYIHWDMNGEHWLNIDKENPRCELTIKRFRHPYEEYRKNKQI